jgi:hypothetical protein
VDLDTVYGSSDYCERCLNPRTCLLQQVALHLLQGMGVYEVAFIIRLITV